jgi:hypothetical protein
MGALADLVQRHKVVYDVRLALSVYTGERQIVGYDIELRGTHEPGTERVTAGCSACETVWMDLRRIADAVLPKEIRLSEYEMPVFDHALHEDLRARRQDVQLTIEIRHREDYNRPLDECEERCLREIVAKLRALGAQERQWSDARAQTAALARESEERAKDSPR